MRMFQTSKSLLTPYEQKKKDAIEQRQRQAQKPVEPEPEFDATSREEVLSQFPGPQNVNGKSVDHSVSKTDQSSKSESSPEQVEQPAGERPISSDESQLLDAIYEVEQQIIALSESEEIEEQALFETRQSLSFSRQRKSELLDTLPASLIAIRSGQSLDQVEKKPTETVQDPPKLVPVSWRHIETKDFAKGIDGLGPQKMERLCEKFPTAGDLNDARIAAAETDKHLQSQLPKQIGKKIANELIERLIRAETDFGTPSAEQQVKQTADEGAVEIEQTESGPSKERSSRQRLIFTVERSIRATMNEPSSLECDIDKDVWKAGYAAFEQSEDVDSCPDEIREELLSDWVKGWLAAELVGSAEDKCAEAPDVDESTGDVNDQLADSESSTIQGADESTADAESKTDESESESEDLLFSENDHINRILSIEKQVRESGHAHQEYNNQFWTDGHLKALDDLPLEACPPGLSDEDTIQFVRGWVTGSGSLGGL